MSPAKKSTKSTKTATKTAVPEFVVGGDDQFREPDFTAVLVGVAYEVYLPKSAASIALAKSVKVDKKGNVKTKDNESTAEVIDALYDWVDKAFGVEQGAAIRERLYDPKDKLDIPHISEFMQKVVEHQTEESENPTS